jgi:hypothetical protein
MPRPVRRGDVDELWHGPGALWRGGDGDPSQQYRNIHIDAPAKVLWLIGDVASSEIDPEKE